MTERANSLDQAIAELSPNREVRKVRTTGKNITVSRMEANFHGFRPKRMSKFPTECVRDSSGYFNRRLTGTSQTFWPKSHFNRDYASRSMVLSFTV